MVIDNWFQNSARSLYLEESLNKLVVCVARTVIVVPKAITMSSAVIDTQASDAFLA